MIGRVFLMGAVAGAGALLLLPGVAAAVSRAARPMARTAAKTGARTYEDLKRAGAEAYEHFEDLAAEVRADIERDDAGEVPPEGTHGTANGATNGAGTAETQKNDGSV